MILDIVRGLALLSYAAIAVLVVTWVSLGDEFNPALLLLVVVPLLLPLRGLIRGEERAHVWACLVILLYLLHGLVTVTGPSAAPIYGYLEIGFALGFLVTASLYLKGRQRLQAAQ